MIHQHALPEGFEGDERQCGGECSGGSRELPRQPANAGSQQRDVENDGDACGCQRYAEDPEAGRGEEETSGPAEGKKSL
jgi:hypothetical protein